MMAAASVGFRPWRSGPTSARQTMEQMRANVRASLTNAAVFHTAREIVARVGSRDEIGQALAIRDWAAQRFRFVKDPLGVETLKTPALMLSEIRARGMTQGDCDDAAALTGALAASVGIPVEFHAVAVGARPPGVSQAPFSHVFAVARPIDWRAKSRRALAFDITRPPDLPPPKFTRRLVVRV